MGKKLQHTVELNTTCKSQFMNYSVERLPILKNMYFCYTTNPKNVCRCQNLTIFVMFL